MNFNEKVSTLAWIVSIVKTHGPISLREINEIWTRNILSRNKPFDRNTFKNYLNGIDDIFGVKISYENRGYNIADKTTLHSGNIQNLLISHIQNIEFFSKFNDLGDKLQTEDFPNGTQFLEPIGLALTENLCLNVEYQKFVDERPRLLDVEPYCLRSIGRRWYLLAKNIETSKMRTYALDRITNIAITGVHFNPDSSIDVANYYSNCIGVYADDQKLDTVVLKVSEFQAKYLRTLPLHSSQQEMESCVFKYRVDITPEFINEIMKMGKEATVLQPESLRNEIKCIIKDMQSNYK